MGDEEPQTLVPRRGAEVARKLTDLGVRGILVTAAEQGYIVELECLMPECFCPEELGGRGYFVGVGPDLPDWMPTLDHIHLKKDGGQRTVENIRLAHRLCNRVDYSIQTGRSWKRDRARIEAARLWALSPANEESEIWKVVVWNMGLGGGGHDGRENWHRLSEIMHDEGIDIALLSEVPTYLLSEVEGAVYEAWGTRGRDRKQRDWCTAVISPHGCREIRDARAMSYRGRRPNVRFENSRPGSWTAAVVPIPGVGDVTCVSLYGLMDELSDPSVHRSLSEVSPLFSDPRYNRLLVLGGDLNSSTQWVEGPHLDTDRVVFDRIKAYGLIDCLEKSREPGRLADCTCTLGDDCRHTWTRLDPGHPALQVDYVFASRGLVDPRLQKCAALSPEDWREWSDHAPIIATFTRSVTS